MSTRPNIAAQKETLKRLGQQSAALLLDVPPRTLRERDAPRNEDGTYNAVELVKWYLARDGSREGDNEPSSRRRREAAQASLAEMKLEAEAGRLISRDLVRANLDRLAHKLRRAVDDLNRRRQLKGSDVQQVINDVLDECQWEM